MAAQHLAAIKIQGAIRKFLYKKRKMTGMLIPYFQHKRLQQQRKLLLHQTSIFAANIQYANAQQQLQYQHQLQQLAQISQLQIQYKIMNEIASKQLRSGQPIMDPNQLMNLINQEGLMRQQHDNFSHLTAT